MKKISTLQNIEQKKTIKNIKYVVDEKLKKK